MAAPDHGRCLQTTVQAELYLSYYALQHVERRS